MNKRLISFTFIIIFSGCIHKPPWFTKQKKTSQKKELPLLILIPSYNNEAWCTYTLTSIMLQNYNNYRVIYFDDHSTDKTTPLVKNFIKKYKQKNITLITNKKRNGALANLWHGIQLAHNDEIVVNLDGDDWFAHNNVLASLNSTYQSDDIWATYGQFQNWPTKKLGWCKEIPQSIVDSHSFRSYGFWFAQPRTYYAWLAKKVKKEDLINPQTNHFYEVAGDTALMFPIIEMAADHIKFIPEVLYFRNVLTPLNDFKTNLKKQLSFAQEIANKKPYSKLPTFQFDRPATVPVSVSKPWRRRMDPASVPLDRVESNNYGSP
jgi:glycosyltransferase involved in cell wall biosynthesis